MRLGSRSFVSKSNHCQQGYFEPDEIQQNFQVVTGAQVTEILLSKTPSELFRATGVHVVNTADGSEWTAYATKEIILSAGSIGTPQLLELSGKVILQFRTFKI